MNKKGIGFVGIISLIILIGVAYLIFTNWQGVKDIFNIIINLGSS